MARILHLVAANHRRGAETFAVELGEHLEGHGHRVRVMAVEDAGTPDRLAVEVAGRSRLDPRGMARILRAARWSEVVVSFGSTSLLSGAIAARLARRPFVYRNIGDPSVWGDIRFSMLRIGAPVGSAARVVALYPDAARTLATSYRLDPTRIRVIPRGVPEDRFFPRPDERTAARRALDLDPDLRWLAYAGALSAEKDPMLAVEALDHLPADVGLVVAGGGPLAPSLRAAARRLGPRLRLLGSVDDIRPVYVASEALLLPSLTEGIPGVAVEAGLSGLPTVSFAVGGVPAVVEHGVTGHLATERTPQAYADAVLATLAKADALGHAARARCLERFSMRTVGAAWADLHDGLLGETTGQVRPPSVLQVVASTQRRGAEMFAHQLEGALEREGLAVTTLAIDTSPHPNPLPIETLGGGRFGPSTLARLVRSLRRHDIAVVHGGTGLWPTMLAAAIARRPFVYRGIGEPSFWGSVPFGSWRIGLPLRQAARVVALYEQAATEYRERYRMGAEQVVVIPNAVPGDAFGHAGPSERRAARTRFGLGEDDRVIGYVGALSPEKRPQWAVTTATRLDQVTLLIAGSGAMEDDLRRSVGGLAPGRVRFLGAISDPETLFAALDVLVLPSRSEGVPAVVIEAALTGTPVVATAVGGVVDLLDDLGVGRAVAPDDLDGFVDAVASTLADPPDRAVPTKLPEQYDLDHVVRAWVDLIGDLLEH